LFPDVDKLNLRPNARNFKFGRELRGYKKQEVDGKINELFRQIDALTAQNSNLSGAMGQFEGKIRALTASTQQLEQERIHENMRLASVMTNAGKTAEETLTQARRQAEQILADARLEGQKVLDDANSRAAALKRQTDTDVTEMQDLLNQMDAALLDIRMATEKYCTEAAAIMNHVNTAVPYIPPPPPVYTAPIPAPPPAPTAYVPQPLPEAEPLPETQMGATDQYEDF
jgi:cell division initiation protein